MSEQPTTTSDKQITSSYMQMDGIQGDVSESGHQNWIQIDSMGFDVSRSFSTESGRVQDR